MSNLHTSITLTKTEASTSIFSGTLAYVVTTILYDIDIVSNHPYFEAAVRYIIAPILSATLAFWTMQFWKYVKIKIKNIFNEKNS